MLDLAKTLAIQKTEQVQSRTLQGSETEIVALYTQACIYMYSVRVSGFDCDCQLIL